MFRQFWGVTTAQFLAQLHVCERDAGAAANTPALVMLHAAPGSALMLSRFQEKFVQPSYVIDLPGTGDSNTLELAGEPTIADYADVIAAGVARHLPRAPIGLYGTLSSVRIALALCARTDVQVRRVI